MNAEEELKVMEVIKRLIENQRPLPAEFAKVLYENYWELLMKKTR